MSLLNKTAIVLSGGGARGAYEVGVLKYLFEDLLNEMQCLKIDTISGTSVGAIHAAFLAAYADKQHRNIKNLENAWLELSFDESINHRVVDNFKIVLQLMKMVMNRPRYDGLFLKTEFLKKLVLQHIDWKKIRTNLEDKHYGALTISATHLASGSTRVFINSQEPLSQWGRDHRIEPVMTHIYPTHVLASASPPLLFPPVYIKGHYYCDGGLRQNTPVSPALYLGAEKVLVVSTVYKDKFKLHRSIKENMPRPYDYIGKILNSLMLDPLEYNLLRIKRINDLIAEGQQEYGKDFLKYKNTPYRYVDVLKISPTENIGKIAYDVYRKNLHRFPYYIRKVIDIKGEESDMLSYLLFDRDFSAQLIELGYQDAKKHHDEICAFFTCAI